MQVFQTCHLFSFVKVQLFTQFNSFSFHKNIHTFFLCKFNHIITVLNTLERIFIRDPYQTHRKCPFNQTVYFNLRYLYNRIANISYTYWLNKRKCNFLTAHITLHRKQNNVHKTEKKYFNTFDYIIQLLYSELSSHSHNRS